MKFDIRPGDLFDWVYKNTNEPVQPNERTWSSPMDQWIPIGGPEPMLCIGITDEVIVLLSAKGLFQIRVGEIFSCRRCAVYAAS